MDEVRVRLPVGPQFMEEGEHEHLKPTAYYTDENWRSSRAPVIPPTWVTKQVLETGVPVKWDNTQYYGNCADCAWPMLYVTEFFEGTVVTRLMPGSVLPAQEWLTYD